MNTDPRDLFINLNPLGLDERDLRKDSSGFADDRTHSDYLVFLAGYKAGAVDSEKSECQRQRPINAEGCKPEISTLPSSTPCAGAVGGRDLNKAEGGTPDNNIHPGAQHQIEPSEVIREAEEVIKSAWAETASVRVKVAELTSERDALRAEISSLRQHKNDYMQAAEETRKALLDELAELQAAVVEFLRTDGLSAEGSAARNKALSALRAALRGQP